MSDMFRRFGYGRLAGVLLLWAAVLPAARAADGPLVDLNAAGLGPGPLAAWANRGSAGGSFEAGGDRPVVATVGGRQAVTLSEKQWLRSTLPAPAGLTKGRPFTLALWSYPTRLVGKQVMVSWASRPYDCAEFGYGKSREGAFCGWLRDCSYRRVPAVSQWHHIAYTYADGALRIYVDGQLDTQADHKLTPKAGEPILLGAGWDAAKKQPCFGFRGGLARVRIWDRCLSHREVRNDMGAVEPFGPVPPDASIAEDRQVVLRWQNGHPELRAVRVFLGEDRRAVESGDASAGRGGNLPAGTEGKLDAGELTLGKTYFWRVEQLGPDGARLAAGPTWSFTVSAGPAARPQPRDRVAGIRKDARELSWTPGRYAVSQTVYFGTDANSVARGEGVLARDLPAATAEVPLPGALDYARTYYWRVDQHNGTLPSARGNVWAFRTADEPRKDDVTFFVGSDCHYGREEINELNARTIDRMNWLAGEPMPKQVGGETVRTPRGVVLCGDLLDNGSDKQTAPAALERLVRDIGLSGEGRLAFPAYEGFGNHDGGPGSFVRQAISERNRRRPGLAAVSANGLHYSWDWDHVHLVQLNLFAGAGPEDVASVTAKPHDPENALDFLREDLARRVGASGRPVVIFQHFGLPPDGMSHWWQESAKDRFRELVRPYQVVAVFHGHSHAATIYQWKGLRIIADGSTQRPESDGGDFFVIRITKDEFIAARRLSDRWGDCVREALRPAPRQSPAKALGGPQPADRMENTNFTNQNEFHQCVR